LLGAKTNRQFGKLPYLLKVLDVKQMLSIQVHPNKKSAVAEFARENKTGISMQAPERNYKDDNHKPELGMALGEFWLLHGFMNPVKLKSVVAAVPEFAFMLPIFEKEGYRGLYAFLMKMEQSRVNEILQPLIDRITAAYKAGGLTKSNPDFWAARAASTYNRPGFIDRGIFSIYLFNIVHLKKGEAVFQDAGILHAYLEGQNIEIMANSDNVLRGGLTPKHIDVGELMKHVIFEPVDPQIIKGESINEVEKIYATPAPDFELSCLLINAATTYQTRLHATDIFLVLNGKLRVRSGETSLECSRGEAFVGFSGSEIILEALENAEIYRASLPAGEGE
jgi:mannose-6-phosphate isomerase